MVARGLRAGVDGAARRQDQVAPRRRAEQDGQRPHGGLALPLRRLRGRVRADVDNGRPDRQAGRHQGLLQRRDQGHGAALLLLPRPARPDGQEDDALQAAADGLQALAGHLQRADERGGATPERQRARARRRALPLLRRRPGHQGPGRHRGGRAAVRARGGPEGEHPLGQRPGQGRADGGKDRRRRPRVLLGRRRRAHGARHGRGALQVARGPRGDQRGHQGRARARALLEHVAAQPRRPRQLGGAGHLLGTPAHGLGLVRSSAR